MVRPEELGGRRAAGSAEIAVVVTPRYDATGETELAELRAGPAVLALMGSSCSQSRFKVAGLDWVLSLVKSVPRRSLVYSDVARASELLAREFPPEAR